MVFLVAITKYDARPILGTMTVGDARQPVLGLHVFASLALPQQAVGVLGKICTHSCSVWKLNDGHAQK
jgi:hypothetical protein